MIHSYKKPAVERFAKRILNGGQDNASHQLIANNQLAGQLAGAAGHTHPIFVKLHGNRRPLANSGGSVGGDEPIRAPVQSAQLNNAVQSNSPTNDQQSMPNMPNMFSATYQSSSNRYIPKLLLPRFQRPKMYSLDGFIPRPNVQKFTTTTTSSLNVNSNNGLTQFQRKSGRKATDKQLDKPNNDESGKRRKVSV